MIDIFAVNWPPAMVKSIGRILNLRIDSALLTDLFASSTAVCITAINAESFARSATVAPPLLFAAAQPLMASASTVINAAI